MKQMPFLKRLALLCLRYNKIMLASILRAIKRSLCGRVTLTVPPVSHDLRWPIISYETREGIDVLPMNKFRGFFGFKQHMEAKPRL